MSLLLYLRKSKNLTRTEALNATSAGLSIVTVYETNPTSASYFSYSKGQSDVLAAFSMAETIGQPHGSIIYFAVDYDTLDGDLLSIKNYFNGIVDQMISYGSAHGGGWGIGVYGSYKVVNYIMQNIPNVCNAWQTGCWNPTNQYVDYSIYQQSYDKTISGVPDYVDINITNSNGHSVGNFTVS